MTQHTKLRVITTQMKNWFLNKTLSHYSINTEKQTYKDFKTRQFEKTVSQLALIKKWLTIIYYVQHSITFAVSAKSVSPTDKQMLVPTTSSTF